LSHVSSPFCSDCFGDRIFLFPYPAWTMVLLSVHLCIAGIIGMYHHVKPLVKMGSYKHFAWAGLEL
jgi:hypothetical protein